MKRSCLLILILTIISGFHLCQAQKSDTLYFNADWKDCAKQDAEFYRTTIKVRPFYRVTDHYASTNKPQMIADCSTITPLVKNGKCTFYNENGTMDSQGAYKNDKKTGNWIIWDKNDKDSSIVEFNSDGTRTWIRRTEESKTASESHNKSQIFTFVQQMPEFPGGDKGLMDYLSSNIKYPEKARKNQTEGTVLLQFVVNEDGSISDVVALREVSDGCTEEAMKVVQSMPDWKPGVQNGDRVKVYFHLPITFKLDEGGRKKNKRKNS